MRRRAVLASVAALAAGSGCARLLGNGPVKVRVMRAPGEQASDARHHCTFQSSFVESHPILERVLSSAASAPEGEWVTTDTNREQGEQLAADLRGECGPEGAVYHFDGGNFLVRVDAGDELLFPRNSTGSEAIRGTPSERRV